MGGAADGMQINEFVNVQMSEPTTEQKEKIGKPIEEMLKPENKKNGEQKTEEEKPSEEGNNSKIKT